jgi:hypothetical protein
MHRPTSTPPSRAALLLACSFAVAALGCASAGPSFVPPSRPAQFSLQGVPWGIPADSVTSLIEPRGYNFNRVDGDGDLWFDGILFRSPTRIYAFMGEERLVKFRVVIGSDDEDALSVYQSARAELIKQYGRPKETTEEFEPPYRKGDGKELEAIRAGKATFHTYWQVGAGARANHVSIHVTEALAVAVDYDGPMWQRESLRRRKSR